MGKSNRIYRKIISEKMTEVMLDLETLSTSGNASILIIAGIKFDRNQDKKPLLAIKDMPKSDIFYMKIDSNSCAKIGLDIDPETVDWWGKQSKKIRDEAFGGKRVPLKEALMAFSKWFGNCKYIWSNGACFDVPILENVYRKCKVKTPWKFYNVRDTRTIWDLAGIKSRDLPQNDLHHALADCHRQIWGVQKSMLKLM